MQEEMREGKELISKTAQSQEARFDEKTIQGKNDRPLSTRS